MCRRFTFRRDFFQTTLHRDPWEFSSVQHAVCTGMEVSRTGLPKHQSTICPDVRTARSNCHHREPHAAVWNAHCGRGDSKHNVSNLLFLLDSWRGLSEWRCRPVFSNTADGPTGIHPYVAPGFHRAGAECRLTFSRFVCSLFDPFLRVFNKNWIRTHLARTYRQPLTESCVDYP